MRIVRFNLAGVDHGLYVNPEYVVVFAPAAKHPLERTLITVDTRISGTNISYEVLGSADAVRDLLAGDVA